MASQEQIDEVQVDIDAIKAAFINSDAEAFNAAMADLLVVLEACKIYVSSGIVDPGGGGDPGSSAP